MYDHILVPTDGTEITQHALDIAVTLHSELKSENPQRRITLLHVIEAIADDESDEFQRFYSTLRNRAEKKMDALIEPYREAQSMGGFTIDPTILLGRRVQEILAFAKDNSVDLIILNSHKIDVENPTQGWGTISYKVGILAQCPVMLVK